VWPSGAERNTSAAPMLPDRARNILSDHGRRSIARKLVRDETREQVGAGAWRERHDHAHDAGGIVGLIVVLRGSRVCYEALRGKHAKDTEFDLAHQASPPVVPGRRGPITTDV